jgi:hypothetical protein
MTQLITEQMLIVANIVVETKRSKWSAALAEEVPDSARDQNSNQVVVKCPPRLAAGCRGQADDANGIVDHYCRECEWAPALVARDHERHLWPCQQPLPACEHGQFRQRRLSALEDLR